YHRLPVKALGNAIFDIPGLTDPAPLDRFWHAPTPPDPDLTRDFLRALAGTTQIKGGFHERTARAHAIPLMVERLERGLYPLPPVSDAELARRQLRPIVRTAVIADAADGEGRALARAAAEPGVRLYLIGTDPEGLARTAGDCRRRGALVATGTAESAAAFDREFPVDLVVAAGGAARHAAEALAEPMRRRGRGTVVVVAAAGETPALRRRFAGVRLVVAGPGWLVRRLAAADPRVAALSADDAAELILRGVARGAAAVALPPALRATRRAVRLGLRRPAGRCAPTAAVSTRPPRRRPAPCGASRATKRSGGAILPSPRGGRETAMLARLGRAAMVPLWTAQLATAAKSFERNRVIGSRRLNEMGLHAARVRLAYRLAERRRARLAGLVSASDRADFARDGFVVRRDFLAPQDFAALVVQLKAYRGGLREIVEGDTIPRKIALAPATLAAVPALS